MNDVRKIHLNKIAHVKEQMKHAGTIHYKDLSRQLRQLERDLREYDFWQNKAHA